MNESTFLGIGLAALLLPVGLALLCFIALGFRQNRPTLTCWLGRAYVLVALVLLVFSCWLVVIAQGPVSREQTVPTPPETVPSIPLQFPWCHKQKVLLPETTFTLDFHIDALSLWFLLLANLVAFAAAWNAARLSEDPASGRGVGGMQHPLFLLGCLSGFQFTMLLVPILDNLIGLWIGIELTTVFSALVVGFRNSPAAWEAAWKYLVITSAGIVLALLATVFLAHGIMEGNSAPGAPDSVLNWTVLLGFARDWRLDENFVTLAFLFALIGYGTKAGLAPMHTWLPDGHGEAPTPVSALLSGVLLKLGLYAILRFYSIAHVALPDARLTSALLLGIGLLSLLVATPFILKGNPFKRVLAYHSVEHMGIICVGLGLGTKLAILGALLHCMTHALTKALMFLAYGNVVREYRRVLHWPPDQSDDHSRVIGVLRVMPWTATLLALGGFALVGTPPFGIFVSELMILLGGLQALISEGATTEALPKWAIAGAVLIFMLTTTLIFFGLVRHLDRLLLGSAPDGVFRRPAPGQQTVESTATRSPPVGDQAGDPPWVEEPGLRDLLPLAFLGLLVAAGVFLAPWWYPLLKVCVEIVQGGAYG